MNANLSPEQAHALWQAGCFFVLADLPEGSEFGVDGTYHTVRRFSGVKFVPPGLHLFTWTPAPRDPSSSSSAAQGPISGALPIRDGVLHHFSPRERLIRKYDPALENVPYPTANDVETIISDDSLRSLDASMAAYPFEGLDEWKQCTSFVTPEVLESVVGRSGRIDGMMEVEGEALTGDQDLRRAMKEMQEQQDALAGSGDSRADEETKLRFVRFDLKRSWPPGSVGEDVTKWSMDKSWLLSQVSKDLPGGVKELLGQLQLAFVLLTHLSSASCLGVYQRILRLFCQARGLPLDQSPSISISLLETLAAQLRALPDDAFLAELPEVDVFYLEQINTLRKSLMQGGATWKEFDKRRLCLAWDKLAEVAKSRFSWSIPPLSFSSAEQDDDDDEYEEEGEDAPVIVET